MGDIPNWCDTTTNATVYAVVVSVAMAPVKKKKKGHEGPRDTLHRKAVFSAGTSPIKSPSSTAARRATTASSSTSRSSSSTRSSASVARGYKSSAPEIEILDSDDEDLRVDPRVHEADFSLDPQRVLSAYSRGSGLNDEVMEEVMITSAIAHRLKKNASASDLCFPPDELMGWMDAIVKNRVEIVALAMQADELLPAGGGTFAARMIEAIPEKLIKRNKTKNYIADRLAETYSVYTAVARIVAIKPSPRSSTGKALIDLVTNLARVHALCAKELQEDREKEKYMKSEKLTGEVIIVCVCPCPSLYFCLIYFLIITCYDRG